MTDIDLIEQLFNTIVQLRKLISQKAYSSHEEKAATMLQFSALNFLQEQANITVGDLAEYLQLSKSSATQLTERLVKMELLNRVADKEDRRVIRLVITKKGKSEFFSMKKEILTKMSRFFAKIPAKDIKELIRINTNLIEVVKE